MDNQENNKYKLLEEVKQGELEIIEVLNNLEKEISDLRKDVLKKEMLLNEINTMSEGKNN